MNIETMNPRAILEQWDREYIEEGFFSNIKAKKNVKEKERKLEINRNIIKKTSEWIKSPRTLGDGYDNDILYVFTKAKSFDELVKFCIKNKNKFNKINIAKDYYEYNNDKEINDDPGCKKAINKLGSDIYEVLFNDDYALCIGKDNKLYDFNIADDEIKVASQSSIFDFEEYTLTELKDADKELHTNLFK